MPSHIYTCTLLPSPFKKKASLKKLLMTKLGVRLTSEFFCKFCNTKMSREPYPSIAQHESFFASCFQCLVLLTSSSISKNAACVGFDILFRISAPVVTIEKVRLLADLALLEHKVVSHKMDSRSNTR